jgi:hypothetical protein
MRPYLPLAVIVVAYLVLAVLFAVRVPDWQTPDEPAHYTYIAQVAEGRLPTIDDGDWDQAALDAYKSVGFRGVTDAQIRAIDYEAHQPPLYYMLAAPVYLLTDGSLTALRIYSALWGVVIILSAYGVGVLMFPHRRFIAFGAAAFVAFQPMHLHILASVNNDSLAWAIVGVGLVLCIAYVKDVPLAGREIRPWMLGVIVGLGLITKATTYFMAGIAALAIVLHWWREFRVTLRTAQRETFPEEVRSDIINPPLLTLARLLAGFLIPALIFGGLWWGRNIVEYGFPDFLGLAAHDVVVADQPRTEARIEALGFGGYVEEMTRTTFQSFWGVFGWMGVFMPDTWYAVILMSIIVAFVGVVLDVGYLHPIYKTRPRSRQRHAWYLLFATAILAILAYLYYNSEFQQYQGRYMFTLMIPLGVWLALGVDAWRRLLTSVLIPRIAPGAHPVTDEALDAASPLWTWSRAVIPLAFVPLGVFSLYLIWRFVPPNL